MTGPSVWFLLLICVSIPGIFCRHDYQYYISKYHKTSTTESPLTSGTATTAAETASTPGFSPLKEITSSEDSESEENALPSEGSQEAGPVTNETILRGDPYYHLDVQYMFIVRIVIIVGSVVGFVVILGCIVCCCPKCCRGRERRGFIIRDNTEDRAIEAHPQQPLVAEPQQPPVFVQHFPPTYNTQEQAQQFPSAPYPQQLPPQYSQQQPYYSPVQQQQQYSPQFYNPPEAPPPYENAPSHKY